MNNNKFGGIKKKGRDIINWLNRENLQLRLLGYYKKECLAHKNINNVITQMHFYTIAFNNPEIIHRQISLIKKNIIGDYIYSVVDNSSEINVRNDIISICNKERIEYISLPYNKFQNIGNQAGSLSHGASLNWLYKNIIQERDDEYFGFIDHDIFPIIKKDTYELIKGKEFYGLFQSREEKWYLWAGYCFFKTEFAKQHKLDFMPCKGLDTGGSNYNILFKNYDKDKIDFAVQKYKHLHAKGVQKPILLEYIDNWMHIFSGSDWKNNKVYDIRMKELEKYIK